VFAMSFGQLFRSVSAYGYELDTTFVEFWSQFFPSP
jgi:hypothetical protein